MNTIKAYKALSVVANVDQGELIKRLIKENEKLKEEKKLIFKYHDAELQVLVDRLEEEDINNCSRCDKWYENCEWKEDVFDEDDGLDNGWFCEGCTADIDAAMEE